MQIVRIMLVNTDNTTVTMAERMLEDQAAWDQFEKMAFELTGEHRRKPLVVERRVG